MPPRNLSIILFACVISLLCYQKAPRSREARTIVHAIETINNNYVEPVDSRELFENAMRGMIGELDQYSSYIAPESYLRFQESLDQEFGGIGILVEGPPQSEQLTVVSPLVGSPAYEAGVQAGDIILQIGDTDTTNMTLEEAVPLMRGVEGSAVELVVKHLGEDEPTNLSVKRAVIQTESVLGDTRASDGSWNYYLEEDPRIGYIRLNTFGEHTVTELREALAFRDHPVQGVIIDLRGNAGGLLKAAVDVCNMFINGGRIVRTRGRGGQVLQEHKADSETTVLDTSLPVVILIDRFSASASEIVAACLQDHARAVLVGERTWGKGSVQNIIELEGGDSAIRLTTATYWRPSGKNIHRRKAPYDAEDTEEWGVKPSEGFQVELTEEEMRQVAETRRDRDVVRTNVAGETIATPDEKEHFDDPQLRAAIDYIEQQLGETQPKAA